MNAKFRLLIKSAIQVASAALLCAGSVAPAHADPLKIRVGSTVSSDVSAAALCLALKNGAFAKAGLDVEMKSFVQSNQKYDAFKGGALDMDINMGAINAAQLYSSGVPVQVLRAVTPADIWGVIARKDSTLSKPSDFRGKKFGVVSLSGTNYGATYLAFKAEGVDFMREVKVSTLPPAALVTALEKGEIDGATTYEPYLTSVLKTGRVKLIFKPGDVYEKKYHDPFIALVIAGRKDFIEKNRAATAKFVAVMEETLASLPSHIDEAAKALIENMPEIKLSEAEAKELLVPYVPNTLKTPNDPMFVKTVQHFYDRLLMAKQLKEPVKASEFWIKP
jgi:ABC-type nitrate/sulfonate/bicarbonate transport system substrate-binding protein